MSQVFVIARVQARAESVGTVQKELQKLVGLTRVKDEGCISYDLFLDNENPAVFHFFETWESGQSLDRHLESGHFRQYLNATEGLLEGSAVCRMTKIS